MWRNPIMPGISGRLVAVIIGMAIFALACPPQVYTERKPEVPKPIKAKPSTPKPSLPAFFDLWKPSPEVKARMVQVKQEITTLFGHAWAGEYYDTNGLSLSLAPQSGFAGVMYSCECLSAQNYGTPTESPSGLLLHFAMPNGKQRFDRFPSRLIPVQWGERHYLIAPDEMVDFCCEVNLGMASRLDIQSHYLLRLGDKKKPVAGFPTVPVEYRNCLLAHPISAKVVAVKAGKVYDRYGLKVRDCILTLNAGSDDTVFPECAFDPAFNTHAMTRAKVTSAIETHRCLATFRQQVGYEPVPRIGWSFSTRSRWYKPHNVK